jgi:hypothetical protein
MWKSETPELGNRIPAFLISTLPFCDMQGGE